jgi:hypothetical protein
MPVLDDFVRSLSVICKSLDAYLCFDALGRMQPREAYQKYSSSCKILTSSQYFDGFGAVAWANRQVLKTR